MEEKKEDIIPNHVFERYTEKFNLKLIPNIVRTKNVTIEGVKVLIDKNGLEWTNSIYDGEYRHIEGVVNWGGTLQVFVYFKKLENDSTYKVYILTNKLTKIEMLLVGLNKFFTIDKI